MIELHPEFLTKNGKKEFAVLSYEEFLKIQELLEDLEDLEDLRKAKEEAKDSPTYSLEKVKKMLDIETNDQLTEVQENEKKTDIFLKITEIISKHLEVNISDINLDSHISNDLGADECDTVEIAIKLEKEFDVLISEQLLSSVKKYPPSYNQNTFGDSVPVACTIRELLTYIYEQLELECNEFTRNFKAK